MPSLRQLIIPATAVAASRRRSSLLLISIITITIILLSASDIRAAKSTVEPPISYDCEEEGFFPHPKDCRKYFWCLDSGPANLGIVPHHFTCPSGLYFNTKTEACDYPANVPCANEKKNKTVLTRGRNRKKSSTSSTTEAPIDAIDDEIVITTIQPQTTTEEDVTQPPTTTPSTTTTTPKSAGRLLKESGAGRQRRPQRPSPTTAVSTNTTASQQDDNLKQLLSLVQSLGGVERIKSLVSDKDTLGNSNNNEIKHHPDRESERINTRTTRTNTNSRPQQTTPPSFFSPSYETPRRQEGVVGAVFATETPNVLASNQASTNQIRHRRPQFDHQPPQTLSNPATVNPFFSYVEPPRASSFDAEPTAVTEVPIEMRGSEFTGDRVNSESLSSSSNNNNNANNNFYSFSYHTPGSRVSVQSLPAPLQHHKAEQPVSEVTRPSALSLPLSSPFNDPFFSYNTPGRFGPSASTHAVETTAAVVSVTEPTTTSVEEAAVPVVRPVRNQNQNDGVAPQRQRQPGRSDGGFVRVRVNPGGNLRLSDPGAHQGSSGRRATRVRIANPSQINPANLLNQASGARDSSVRSATSRVSHQATHRNPPPHHQPNNQPSVLYDEDRELHHINSEVARTEVPVDFVTTRRPVRRRPPQREHLRNRQEENPVGALVNLPPPNLQLEQAFPPAIGHGGIGRPFPPRPQHFAQTLPPLSFTGTSPRSAPRILPIAVPLVTLPPPAPESPSNTGNQPSSLFSPLFPNDANDAGFKPGTIRYSSLNLPPPNQPRQSSPRPQFEEFFVTDFPFFNENTPSQTPAAPSTTATTTTTTTPAPTTGFFVEPSTRRQRQRQRRPTAATAPTFVTPAPQRREPPKVVTPQPVLSYEEPAEPSGPPVEMDSGHVKCTRRGVFAHPGSCGQFVVCAPASRGSLTYRSYMHHCPAEQVFVEEVGRCRPGNKEKCEVFNRRR